MIKLSDLLSDVADLLKKSLSKRKPLLLGKDDNYSNLRLREISFEGG